MKSASHGTHREETKRRHPALTTTRAIISRTAQAWLLTRAIFHLRCDPRSRLAYDLSIIIISSFRFLIRKHCFGSRFLTIKVHILPMLFF